MRAVVGRAVVVCAMVACVIGACVIGACAVDDRLPPSPEVAATAEEARLAERLRVHLAAVPGVASASVIVHIPPVDPFARAPVARAPVAPSKAEGLPSLSRDEGPASAAAAPAPARAAIVLATRAGADPALLGDAAITAGRAVLGPGADVQVQIAPPPPPSPALVRVGPFRVAPSSRGPLVAVLATALAAIAALSAALALALYRRGINPHQSSTSTTRGS